MQNKAATLFFSPLKTQGLTVRASKTMTPGSRDGNARTRTASCAVSATCPGGQASGAQGWLSLSSPNQGLSRAPASRAVAAREVTPLQGWRQELGLVAAGSSSCCTNCSLPVPNPAGSQSPASPHGHARQQNPSFLRRYEVYEARGLRGFPQASGHRSAALTCLSSGFH